MKKILGTFIVIMLLTIVISKVAFAEIGEWKIVDRNVVQDVDYSTKVGDYFFAFEEEYVKEKYESVSYLCYSKNGKDFCKTEYQTASLPIYSNDLYFLFDTTMNDVPENKRVYGFNNSPSYILDKELNLINKIEHNGYAVYEGFYNGYHYFTCNDYNDVKYENGWIGETKRMLYKTENGIEMIPVNTDKEDLSFLYGICLNDNNIIKQSFGRDDKAKIECFMKNKKYGVLFEKDGFLSYYYGYKRVPLLVMYYKVGEEVVDWIYDRKAIQSIEKKYLSLDGIYGIEMPEDIGNYRFEVDGNFYFDRDEKTYYCIAKELLENKIKVIYKDKILAFEVAPSTESDRTLVSMRFLFEQMGAKVDWNDKSKTAIVQKDGNKIEFSIDKKTATVNGSQKEMDVPARLINDKTMIPLRFLSEELGYKVDWDEDTKSVTIYDK